jgi:hypothetical protein
VLYICLCNVHLFRVFLSRKVEWVCAPILRRTSRISPSTIPCSQVFRLGKQPTRSTQPSDARTLVPYRFCSVDFDSTPVKIRHQTDAARRISNTLSFSSVNRYDLAFKMANASTRRRPGAREPSPLLGSTSPQSIDLDHSEVRPLCQTSLLSFFHLPVGLPPLSRWS